MWRNSTLPVTALFVLCHVLIFIFVLNSGPYSGLFNENVNFFYGYASQISAGKLPYADFAVEYPPLALFCIALPALFTHDQTAYVDAFLIEMLIFDVLCIIIITLFSKRSNANIWKTLSIFTLCLLAIGPLVAVRFDLVAASICLLSIYLFQRGRYNFAWAFLALGVMAKIFPVVIAPIFLIFHLRHSEIKQALAGTGIFVLCVSACSFLPLLLSPEGYLGSYTYHLNRPIQLESLYSSLLLAGQLAGLTSLQIVFSFGSFNIISPAAEIMGTLSNGFTLLALAIVYVHYWRFLSQIKDEPEKSSLGLVSFSIAAILAFMVFNKVLSPQFIIWIYPLIALTDKLGKINWLIFILIGFMTTFIYPKYYDGLRAGHGVLVGFLLVRNMLLVALLALIIKSTVKGKRNDPPKKVINYLATGQPSS
ncbi:glycosyltransferase 87 family protein [Dehalogenimonas alkenigignens]|uniref:glycosyltransferase 87 family protein n=1 Tax=Dehalogenimonas alkenigignens TaxID=1217799 RepID=UPI000D573316|nr:glycosyltransferase 87 family protein [Dehalogenimonas alkenigignens]PVV84404.1 hypothetical protein DD509_03685 [Dehalogenimonas alkenigignens]